MQKDPEVFTADAKFFTNLIFVLVVEEDSSQQLPILLSEFSQRPLHQVRAFVLKQTRLHAGLTTWDFPDPFRKLTKAAIPPKRFLDDMVRNRVNVSPQTLGMLDGSLPEIAQDPQKRLLPDIVGHGWGPEPG